MVRIKIRLVRLVHHLAAHYTVSVAMHMILSTDLDTSLVKDRRETEKILTSVGLPCRGRGAGGGSPVAACRRRPLRTNSRHARLSTRSITLAEAPPSNHSCRPYHARRGAHLGPCAATFGTLYLQRHHANAHTYLLTTLYGKKP